MIYASAVHGVRFALYENRYYELKRCADNITDKKYLINKTIVAVLEQILNEWAEWWNINGCTELRSFVINDERTE